VEDGGEEKRIPTRRHGEHGEEKTRGDRIYRIDRITGHSTPWRRRVPLPNPVNPVNPVLLLFSCLLRALRASVVLLLPLQ
jgi:hypothetical protein